MKSCIFTDNDAVNSLFSLENQKLCPCDGMIMFRRRNYLATRPDVRAKYGFDLLVCNAHSNLLKEIEPQLTLEQFIRQIGPNYEALCPSCNMWVVLDHFKFNTHGTGRSGICRLSDNDV